MRIASTYIAFIALIFFVGMTSAFLSPPGGWYEGLNKPWFNPPNWIFPIAWTALYIMIGMAGARVWLAGLLGAPILFWILQLGLNGLWSYLFFGLHSPIAAFIEILVLLATIIGFILTTRRDEPIASLLFVPYVAWVGFATLLNGAIVYLNN
ncbi:MAG: TspO/MBR family protein [Hyphomicrobiales bacterium]